MRQPGPRHAPTGGCQTAATAATADRGPHLPKPGRQSPCPQVPATQSQCSDRDRSLFLARRPATGGPRCGPARGGRSRPGSSDRAVFVAAGAA